MIFKSTVYLLPMVPANGRARESPVVESVAHVFFRVCCPGLPCPDVSDSLG